MSIPSIEIYKGVWTDWSKGDLIMGSQLTMCSESAGVLAASLALFVSIATTHLWALVAFGVHHSRQQRTQNRCLPILRQQQLVLGADLPPFSAALRFAQLFWANRPTVSSLRFSWHLILVSLLCGLTGIVVGIFSSKIIDISPKLQVLVNPLHCGFVDRNNTWMPNQTTVPIIQYYLDSLAGATTFSKRCYNITEGRDCGPFSDLEINWKNNWVTDCPFNETMCLGPAMQIDTELMNSNTILGINSAPEDEVNLRKVTTCAPINQDNYTTRVASDASTATMVAHCPGDEVVMSVYGPSRRQLGDNYTTGISEYTANSTLTRTMWTEYYFNGQYANFSTFTPIPELQNLAGDGTLCFISSNAFLFAEPCDDPVFSAHKIHWDSANKRNFYLGDRVTGVIGCLEQYQFCDQSNHSCTRVGNLGDTKDEVRDMSLTATQEAIIDMLIVILGRFANIPFIGSRVTEDLMADQKANGRIQLPLPSNQWQEEVQAWHGIVMKLLQLGLVEWAGGPWKTSLQTHLVPLTSPEQEAMCHNQRVRPGANTGLANVSIFGLSFILAWGTLVVLTSLSITYLARKKGRAWIQDDVLQIQRREYQIQEQMQIRNTGFNSGLVWTGSDLEIPSVKNNNLLPPLFPPAPVAKKTFGLVRVKKESKASDEKLHLEEV